MKLALISLVATFLVASVCNAEPVVGCARGERVTFQDSPCPEGARIVPTFGPASVPSTTVKTDTQSDGDRVAVSPVQMVKRYRYAIHSNHVEIQVGMLDLHVLNNRQWGKPQHISRSRLNRAWHEYWDYTAGANVGKQLHFINGALVDIADQESLQTPTRMSSVTTEEKQ